MSVGGWTTAIASANTWFNTDVETLNAFWFATLFIISNNFSTLCPVLADMNRIGAYDKYGNFKYTSLVYFSKVPFCLSYSSHLFIAIITPFPASWASPAIFVSCSVTPCVASIIKIQTSALSIASKVLATLYFSIFSSILLCLLIPAVSIKTYFPWEFSNSESIASLVVPAILLTINLFSPRILLINEDLPTFGFPITATLIWRLSSSFSCFGGNLSYISSKTSPIPIAFTEETLNGSPNPRL